MRAAWCGRVSFEGSPLRTMLGRRELCRMTGACLYLSGERSQAFGSVPPDSTVASFGRDVSSLSPLHGLSLPGGTTRWIIMRKARHGDGRLP